MSYSEAGLRQWLKPATTGITVYGCGPDEAALFQQLAPRFGVEALVTAEGVTETTADLALGNQCVSVGHKARITNGALLALSRAGVRYLSTRSIGFDHVDLAYAENLGITVENVSYSPDSVADYTLMLMLMVLRTAKAMIRRTDRHDYRLDEIRGKELRDLTVGVIGTGRIGSAVLNRLRGFGCRTLAYDNQPRTSAAYVPLDELLQDSDIVSLHTPLTAQTHHLLNKHRIEHLRHGAFVVNTGRGALIDTEALLPALDSGRLGGAALDVLEGEEGIFYADCSNRPLDRTLVQLQRLPNVIVSPHTAYYTDRALSDLVENSLTNCLAFARRKQEWI
jgi:D-specific alpha-keto acid dehydrogenase